MHRANWLGGLPWRRLCRSPLLLLLLPLLLLFMQQGALLHEWSHHAAPASQDESQNNGHDEDDKQHAPGEPCAACLAFAHADAAAAPGLAVAGLLTDLSFQTLLTPRTEVVTNALPTPRSRGPPISL